MTLSLRTDRALIRSAASSTRYLLAEIIAPEAPARENRLPVNVAVVLDRSGSMSSEDKFGLAVDAVTKALAMLDRNDRFSLVVFDEHVDVLAHSTNATSSAKQHALDALRQISPRGCTDLCSGWMHGCDEVAEFIANGTVSRTLLLTDGLANRGTVSRDALVTHARELRERGIITTTFGVGADFDERLLRDMANSGDGNFYFIQNAAQIPDLMMSELGETLDVVIPSAVLNVRVPAGAEAELMNSFQSEYHAVNSSLRIQLGDLVSGQDLRLVIRVKFPRGESGRTLETSASLRGDEFAEVASEVVTWTYADHEANDVQARNRNVDREVATIYAARARGEATEANRGGDLDGARRVLEATARRIRDYAGDDSVLCDLASALRREVPRYASIKMSARTLKSAFYEAELGVRERAIDGKAKRKAPR